MTTADLINKKEEEKKNNPPQSTKTSTFKPIEGMSMEEARVLGGMPEPERENAVSLYDDGVNSGNKKTITGSPINTKEYADFREKLIQPQDFGVETEEQKKKRERADFIKQGLTGFTEGLSALANLYYTTKGAPSQKLTSQMPALQQQLYQERLERDKKLENYRAWIRDKARRDDERAWQEKVRADENARQDAIRKEQTEEDRRRWDYTAKKQEEETAKADARYAEEKAYNRRVAELQRNEQVRHNKAMEANAAVRANRNNGRSGRLLRIQKPNGEPMVFSKDDLENGVNLAYIYNSLPDEYKVRDTKQYPQNEKGEIDIKNGKHPISNNPTKYEMEVAIGRALQAGAVEEIAEGIQVGATNPIHSNPQQSGSVIDWKPSSNNSNQANALVDWKPTSAKDIQEALDKQKRRKQDVLKQGKDSLEKQVKNSSRSDTFR